MFFIFSMNPKFSVTFVFFLFTNLDLLNFKLSFKIHNYIKDLS